MKNIVLTGFMGTGKTTVGKIIAQKLNRPFFDTDEIIEQKLDASISEIFRKIGEKEFRKFESETIALVSNIEGAVISCGGGAVLNYQNVQLLRSNGIIINLFASAQHILKRIGQDDNRPLIKQMMHPLDEIKKMLAKRKKAYDNCDLAFDTEGISSRQVAENILSNSFVKDMLKNEAVNEI